MIEPKIKGHYKDLIRKLSPRQEVYDALVMFVDKYDGTNDDQFHSLMLVVISLLSEIEDLKIIKNGFDQIAQLSRGTSEEVNSILARFRDIQNGSEPQLPMSGASDNS